MQRIPLNDIAKIVNGKLLANQSSTTVEYVLTDSRTVSYAESSCFFALITKQNNGHNYIEEAYNKGVRNFVVSEEVDISLLTGCTICLVVDTLEALQSLAAWWREQFNGKVIGITGSNGKTIIKEWLHQVLYKKFMISRSPKSYNSQIGVPLSVWNIDPAANLAIIEAGISEPGEMFKLETVIKPDIVILSNIGEAHQVNFSSYNQKIKEKLELAKNAELIQIYGQKKTVNVLDEINLHGAIKIWHKHEVISTIDNKTARILIKTLGLEFIIPFTDKASIDNAVHCAFLAKELGLSDKEIHAAMADLEPVAMRLELKEGLNACTLINDAYNSDIEGLRIALDFLNQQAKSANQAKTVILSDFSQIEQEDSAFYNDVIRLLEEKGISQLIGVGERISKYGTSFNGKCHFYSDTNSLLAQLSKLSFNNETILIKGARSFFFEKLLPVLEVRSHKTRLEVDLQAIVWNFKQFKKLHRPNTKIMAMVKAFAYGSGSYEVARLLQYHGCDYLAVAVTDEGIALREQGIHLPIMVLSPEIESIDRLIEYNLETEVYDIRQLNSLKRHLSTRNVKQFKIHIKVDTGMHRLGFDPSNLDLLLELLQSDDTMQVQSVFSHLAGADEEQFDEFTLEQIRLFQDTTNKIETSLGYSVIKHILNSAGQERFSEFQFDMCRLGIGLYGVSTQTESNLKPVASFKTNILQIREVGLNDTVGYSRKGRLNKEARIATLPVGYADGLDRRLSNGVGYVLINGKKAPYVGNICMDLCMVDVTDISTHIGDEVEIFGYLPTIMEVAQQIGTIPYEVIARIAQRVKRIYISES